MNIVKRSALPALAAIVAAVALIGCQKQGEGGTQQGMADRADKMQADASRKMDDAKQDVKQAADATANKVSDATITAEVNTALARDPGLSALHINVDTADGRVVLHGKAPDTAARERATTLAQNVKGVVSVDNQLAVEKG